MDPSGAHGASAVRRVLVQRLPTDAHSVAIASVGVACVTAGWAVLWTVESFWNPLAFTTLWTGVAIVAWSISPQRHPGVRRHMALVAISIPCWWWFELVNARVQNWRYVYSVDYSDVEYAMLSTCAFATVVPAIVAVTSAIRGTHIGDEPHPHAPSEAHPAALWLIGSGLLAQAVVFAFPTFTFPLVWVAPFLVVDGLVLRLGGRSVTKQIVTRRWREPLVIAAAGLTCGVLWEFWNFWSAPHWVYELPALDFADVFEMPVLGYGGYVPFAWFVVQLVRTVDIAAHQLRGRRD